MADLSNPPAIRSPGRLLPIREVMRETGLHRATIYRRINAGEFPRSIRLGTRTVRWAEADIEAWKQERIAAQD